MQNELATVVQQTGLEPAKTDVLLSKFGIFYEKAKEIAQNSKSIVVTDEDQIDEMKRAREARLALKDIRVDAEKVRKELKEQSLREGRAIDGVYNLIAALIVPVEKHLEQQEKFAEVREAERQAKKHADRIEQLSKFVEDVSLYNLKDMSDEAFEKLLQNSKTAYDAQKAAEAKAEEERLAKLEADRLEQIKIREENERLKKEAEAAEKKRAEERAVEQRKFEAEQKAKLDAENKLKAERELAEKKALEEKQRIENEKRLEEQRLAKIKADEEEAQRKALLAPDKEKILKWVLSIETLAMPNVASKQAGDAVRIGRNMLLNVIEYLEEEAKKL